MIRYWNTVVQEKPAEVVYGARQVVGRGVQSPDRDEDENPFVWCQELTDIQIRWS